MCFRSSISFQELCFRSCNFSAVRCRICIWSEIRGEWRNFDSSGEKVPTLHWINKSLEIKGKYRMQEMGRKGREDEVEEVMKRFFCLFSGLFQEDKSFHPLASVTFNTPARTGGLKTLWDAWRDSVWASSYKSWQKKKKINVCIINLCINKRPAACF